MEEISKCTVCVHSLERVALRGVCYAKGRLATSSGAGQLPEKVRKKRFFQALLDNAVALNSWVGGELTAAQPDLRLLDLQQLALLYERAAASSRTNRNNAAACNQEHVHFRDGVEHYLYSRLAAELLRRAGHEPLPEPALVAAGREAVTALGLAADADLQPSWWKVALPGGPDLFLAIPALQLTHTRPDAQPVFWYYVEPDLLAGAAAGIGHVEIIKFAPSVALLEYHGLSRRVQDCIMELQEVIQHREPNLNAIRSIPSSKSAVSQTSAVSSVLVNARANLKSRRVPTDESTRTHAASLDNTTTSSSLATGGEPPALRRITTASKQRNSKYLITEKEPDGRVLKSYLASAPGKAQQENRKPAQPPEPTRSMITKRTDAILRSASSLREEWEARAAKGRTKSGIKRGMTRTDDSSVEGASPPACVERTKPSSTGSAASGASPTTGGVRQMVADVESRLKMAAAANNQVLSPTPKYIPAPAVAARRLRPSQPAQLDQPAGVFPALFASKPDAKKLDGSTISSLSGSTCSEEKTKQKTECFRTGLRRKHARTAAAPAADATGGAGVPAATVGVSDAVLLGSTLTDDDRYATAMGSEAVFVTASGDDFSDDSVTKGRTEDLASMRTRVRTHSDDSSEQAAKQVIKSGEPPIPAKPCARPYTVESAFLPAVDDNRLIVRRKLADPVLVRTRRRKPAPQAALT